MDKLARAYKIGASLAISKYLPKLSRKQKALVGGGALGALGLKGVLPLKGVAALDALSAKDIVRAGRSSKSDTIADLSGIEKLLANNQPIIGKGGGLPSPLFMPRRADSLEWLIPNPIKSPIDHIQSNLASLADASIYPRDSIAGSLYRVRDAGDLVKYITKTEGRISEIPEELYYKVVGASSAAAREARHLMESIYGPMEAMAIP